MKDPVQERLNRIYAGEARLPTRAEQTEIAIRHLTPERRLALARSLSLCDRRVR